MKKLIDYSVYVILLILGWFTRSLSQKMRIKVGKFISTFFKLLFPSRIDIAIENLQYAFPEFDDVKIKRIADESFENLGITLIEILAMKTMPKNKIQKWVKFENLELFKKLHSKNKGLIMLSAHFGNWELGALSGTMNMGVNYLIIVEHQANDFIDREMNKIRTRFGNRVVSRYKAAREIVDTLSKGEVLALIADQSATKDKDVFVDFFGRPAATYKAPAVLAKKYDLPVILGVSVRQPDGSYVIELVEIPHDDLPNNNEGIKELTARHTKVLEKFIRLHPGHWSWMHRRWKHNPPVAADEKAIN